jgi:hypothetical protein
VIGIISPDAIDSMHRKLIVGAGDIGNGNGGLGNNISQERSLLVGNNMRINENIPVVRLQPFTVSNLSGSGLALGKSAQFGNPTAAFPGMRGLSASRAGW